jgi:SSS family transporter
MDSLRLGLPTLVGIVAYLLAINLLGARLGRGQKDAGDYFLGGHAIPWWAVMASIVATETSALTFLSIPGDAYQSRFTFLQIALGYVVGRILVAWILLPSYFRGTLPTAYALLERRFGVATRRFASSVFMVTRVLAASVRLAVPAIPLAFVLGVPVWVAILILASATALYTWAGGIKAVIWIDLIQVTVYLSGAALALALLAGAIPGGLFPLLARTAVQPGAVFDFSLDLSRPYTFWAGLLGGTFLAMASHGADQLIVQRLLACRGLRDAQKALIGSGVAILLQFAVFLSIGVALFSFYGGRPIAGSGLHPAAFHSSDEIFPAFIVQQLPPGLSAYLIAGIFSAAMCSEASALNSLASALAHDVVGPVFGAQRIEGRSGLWLGRALTLLWTVLLAALAIGFSGMGQGQPGVQVALGLVSVTAGGLLGAFLLARYARRARQGDAIASVATSALVVFAIWLGAKGWIDWPGARGLAWPWYSFLGSVLTVGTGFLLAVRNPGPDPRLERL